MADSGQQDATRLDVLVRQHAATSELLGVPFVPAYRSLRSTYGSTGASAVPHDGHESCDLSTDVSKEVKIDSDAMAPRPVSRVAAELASESAPVPLAGSPQTLLNALRERYLADEPHASFETNHTSVVFGEGDPSARLMFIGEAPGEEEDRVGRPFVGKSGQLLDKMIVAMGLSREAVYIANVLKTRPPGNRTPTLDEARVCAPYLYEQIEIVSPEVIVTLGKSAGQLLLGTAESMGDMRGRWTTFPPPNPLVPIESDSTFAHHEIAVMPTYHPAFLLRSYTPENRAMVWGDLKLVMERLGLPG